MGGLSVEIQTPGSRHPSDNLNLDRARNFGSGSGFDESFELHLAVHDFDDVLNITAILLFLQVLCLLQNKLIETGARELPGVLSGLLLGLQEGLVELIHFLRFAFRLGTDHAKRARRGSRTRLDGFLRLLSRAFRFHRFRRGAEMPLHFSFFLLLSLLPEDVFIFCVGLGKVVQAEPLPVLQFPSALRVPLHRQINAPLDFRRRPLSATAEVLIVLNLELADVPLELAQLLVDRRHGWKRPSNYHARGTKPSRQQKESVALRIGYPARALLSGRKRALDK